MTTTDKAKNTAQKTKGKAKETIGKATGNDDLQAKGKTDQTCLSVGSVVRARTGRALCPACWVLTKGAACAGQQQFSSTSAR